MATPLVPLAMAATSRAGRLARAAVLRRSPRPERTLGDLGTHIEALGASFDGRLRIAAVDRASGRRVIFGAPDAPRATVAQAVLASCAVPWVFAPVEIGEREYVDGGVWSPTNLDAVPAGRGSRILCLIPTAGATLTSLRTASAAAAGYESMALRARGATVADRSSRTSPASTRSAPNLMEREPARRGRRGGLRARPAADRVTERFYGELATWWPLISPKEDVRRGGGRDRAAARAPRARFWNSAAAAGATPYHLKGALHAHARRPLTSDMLAVSRGAQPGVRASAGRHAHACG